MDAAPGHGPAPEPLALPEGPLARPRPQRLLLRTGPPFPPGHTSATSLLLSSMLSLLPFLLFKVAVT